MSSYWPLFTSCDSSFHSELHCIKLCSMNWYISLANHLYCMNILHTHTTNLNMQFVLIFKQNQDHTGLCPGPLHYESVTLSPQLSNQNGNCTKGKPLTPIFWKLRPTGQKGLGLYLFHIPCTSKAETNYMDQSYIP
jgi:hypothetical protein